MLFRWFNIKFFYYTLARVADILAHWAWAHYKNDAQKKAITSTEVSKFTQDIWTTNHHIIADEPANIGGNNKGATPFELLQAALASCTVITLRMYCKKKAIKLEHLSVDIVKESITVLNDETQKPVATHLYNIKLNIKGDLSDKDKKRLTKIAAKCPVHLALKSTPQFKISIN